MLLFEVYKASGSAGLQYWPEPSRDYSSRESEERLSLQWPHRLQQFLRVLGLLCWKNNSYISQTEVLLFQEASQWLFFTWPLLEEFKALQPPLTGHCADFSAHSHHGNSKITQVCIRWSEAFQSRLCKPAPGYILIIWGLSGNMEITNILKNTSETNRVLNISKWEEPTWLGGDSSSKRLYAAALQAFSKSNDFLACNILQRLKKIYLCYLNAKYPSDTLW